MEEEGLGEEVKRGELGAVLGRAATMTCVGPEFFLNLAGRWVCMVVGMVVVCMVVVCMAGCGNCWLWWHFCMYIFILELN